MDPIELSILEHLNDVGLLNQSSRSNQINQSRQSRHSKQSGDLLIAYSGGLDSSVLLHAAHQLLQAGRLSKLSAIHINHGLQSEADQWQEHCQNRCNSYAIDLVTQKFSLAAEGKNSELAARNTRYQSFSDQLTADRCIALAHHCDDQVETLLFRLFRGTGLHGMRGIPSSRQLAQGWLIRPFLKFSRQQLVDYAEQHHLQWIEDPSNQTNQYHRNFIRNEVLPLIRSKWHSISNSLTLFSSIANEQVEILEEVAEQDLSSVSSPQMEMTLTNLQIPKLLQLSTARQKNLLHFWIRNLTKQSPSNVELLEILRQLKPNQLKPDELKSDSHDSIKVKAGTGSVRSFNGRLFFCRNDEAPALKIDHPWPNIQDTLQLDNGMSLSFVNQQSLKANANSSNLLIRQPESHEVVSVRARQGGEKTTPSYREHSAELKKIYQELNVPPWQRVWLPLIYYDEILVCVPGIFVAKSYQISDDAVVFEISG